MHHNPSVQTHTMDPSAPSSVLTLPVKSFSCVLMNGCNADCDAAKTQLESGTELQNNSLGLGGNVFKKSTSVLDPHLGWPQNRGI